jgi:hypothetical protein
LSRSCGIQVALRRGERSTVELRRVSPNVTVHYWELDEDQTGSRDSAWRVVAASGNQVEGESTFDAPYGGLFVFTVEDARVGLSDEQLDEPRMTWAVSPAR